ncbi:MAG: hypothetical protein WEB00_05545 [Dehalococcoidia bacterium]
MRDQPLSHEDYDELAEALDAGTANELLRQGWHLLAAVQGGPVTYVFGKPRVVDIQEVIESTEAILEDMTSAQDPLQMSTPLQARHQ